MTVDFPHEPRGRPRRGLLVAGATAFVSAVVVAGALAVPAGAQDDPTQPGGDSSIPPVVSDDGGTQPAGGASDAPLDTGPGGGATQPNEEPGSQPTGSETPPPYVEEASPGQPAPDAGASTAPLDEGREPAPQQPPSAPPSSIG